MATRRGHNEGSIYRREQDGRWIGALTVSAGKRKYLTGKTRQEVQTKLAKALDLARRGVPLGDERQAMGAYFLRWLETVKPTIQPSTIRAYDRDVRLRIVPQLGAVKLAKLSPQHIQTFYADLLTDGLSSTSVRHCHAVLHHGLDDAMRLGLIPRNVSELINVPRKRATEMHVWTAEEARRFLESAGAADDRQYPLYFVALATGMRLGELLALSWRAVDLQRRRIAVQRNVWVAHGKAEWGEPKTKRSRRQIAFPADVADALREHRVRQHRERLTLGPAWTDNGLVFPDETGAAMSHGRVYPNHFRRNVKRAGVPMIRFHDLRHTCATILLGRGVNPKIVSEMLGHSSVAITLDIYSHILPDMQQDASDEMGSALGG